jgi:hypothetical protein
MNQNKIGLPEYALLLALILIVAIVLDVVFFR